MSNKPEQRIDDAIVKARVAALAQAGQEKELEKMRMGGTVTYGNYFKMTGRGPYAGYAVGLMIGARRPHE